MTLQNYYWEDSFFIKSSGDNIALTLDSDTEKLLCVLDIHAGIKFLQHLDMSKTFSTKIWNIEPFQKHI